MADWANRTYPLTVEVEPLALEQAEHDWLTGLTPYVYQSQVYDRVRRALTSGETLCLFLVTPTGSGKTLGSFAYAIKHDLPIIGVYPTNELIRDQERALKSWLDPRDEFRLVRIDSAQLDDWQVKLELKRHSQTLERLMRWQPAILTNPDILFYTFFGLYAGPAGLSQRLFSLVGQYKLFVFDEFHLYNVKQMADVAFLVGTLHAIQPKLGRVFIFASATPDSPVRDWLNARHGLTVETVEASPSECPRARRVAHPLHLTVLPADLQKWKGDEALVEFVPRLKDFISQYPHARLVTILDSVAQAIQLSKILREQFPHKSIGEVHGFSSEQERARALRQELTIGTSTIEVGIDFKDESEKDILIFEARTASQAIQRLGRIARHEKRQHPSTPNWVIAVVPEYVYEFLSKRLAEGQSWSRPKLYELLEQAYSKPEDFALFLRKHAAAEFQEATAKILAAFQPDDQPHIREALSGLVKALTDKEQGQAWGLRKRYEEQGILQPLLTFRTSGFEAAILDQRGTDLGFPVKRYDLLFVLRRGVFTEIDHEALFNELEQLSSKYPEEAAREQRYCKPIELGSSELLGLYGYFKLTDLLAVSRKVWFEVDEDSVRGRKAQVTVVSGLQIATDPPTQVNRLNRFLRNKQIVAWFVDKHPSAVRLGRALPPLFALYELRVRRVGGGLGNAPWSIAFNQDAFFVDSLGWWREIRKDDPVIV